MLASPKRSVGEPQDRTSPGGFNGLNGSAEWRRRPAPGRAVCVFFIRVFKSIHAEIRWFDLVFLNPCSQVSSHLFFYNTQPHVA